MGKLSDTDSAGKCDKTRILWTNFRENSLKILEVKIYRLDNKKGCKELPKKKLVRLSDLQVREPQSDIVLKWRRQNTLY